jgi:hypothetical protein
MAAIDRQSEGLPAIVVVSCDRYSSLWRPFFSTFFKYWPDCPYPVYLGTGFGSFEHPKVSCIQVGQDIDYSSNLLSILSRIPAKWIIFWVEDRVISSAVSTETVRALVSDAQAQGAAYLKLIPEHPLAYSEAELPFGVIPRGTSYRVSMTVCLWQKQVLESLLVRGETAWEIEKRGSTRSNQRKELFLGLNPKLKQCPPIPHEHLVIKGRVFRRVQSFLRREGLESDLMSWPLQTWKNRLYVWAYESVTAILRPYQAWRLSRSTDVQA